MNQTTKTPRNEPETAKGGAVKFHTTILQAGKTATGIEIPDEIIEKLGAGKRPPVRVTINGQTYRSTVAAIGGKFLLRGIAENRPKTRVARGDAEGGQPQVHTQPRGRSVPPQFPQGLKKK